ncbi:MAG: hypothetical protein AB7O97_09365 [Planctomycetota bacterium]
MRRTWLAFLGLGLPCLGAVGYLALQVHDTRAELAQLQETATRAADQLELLAKEMTRFRIEQSAEGRGPQALLEKLRAYAPALVSARTADPNYQQAQEEMQAVLRAFESLGADGWEPVVTRFQALHPVQNFDELKWLLEAAVRCDPARGNHLVGEVLAGRLKPNPRLRWSAADLLLRTDPERARQGLRQILLTETRNGVDPDRAAGMGLPTIDPSAMATAGFHNFLLHYLRADDPQAEETLLVVLTRTGQDIATLQEAIEALGAMRSTRALKRIEELYRRPPGAQQNALFLNKCLDALVAIRGGDARGFLEEQLARAEHELVIAHIQALLQDLGATRAAAVPAEHK